MEEQQPNYREQLFDTLAHAIEDNGKSDPSYDNYQKALDILEVLESLLAYTIYSTCDSPDNIRDACDETHVNIKKRALKMFENDKK
jgi:hypothetical protein